MTVHTRTKLFTLLLPLLLAACGGGGGGVVSQASAASSSASTPSSDQFHGIAVPPEPDAAANSTLLGVDSDNNGVRDDVDREIAKTYGANSKTYAGALRLAKSDQEYLLANGDIVKSTAATSNSVLAGACINRKLNNDPITAYKIIDYIFAISINSSERMAAYKSTSKASKEVFTKIPTDLCK